MKFLISPHCCWSIWMIILDTSANSLKKDWFVQGVLTPWCLCAPDAKATDQDCLSEDYIPVIRCRLFNLTVSFILFLCPLRTMNSNLICKYIKCVIITKHGWLVTIAKAFWKQVNNWGEPELLSHDSLLRSDCLHNSKVQSKHSLLIHSQVVICYMRG